MSASISDLITEARKTTNPTLTTVATARAIGGTSLVCTDLSGWPTNTAVHFITYKKTPAGAIDKSTQCDWKGLVSTNTINTLTLKSGTDAGNSVGDYVEMGPTAAYAQDLASALEVAHNTDGTIKSGTAATNMALTTPTLDTPSFKGAVSGWISANESWSYSSYDSTNATGVITVPSDATTKYSSGMKVQFTQTTVKYGIITAVATTSITVYFGTDYSLANATISANSYSVQKAPFGFPLNPAKWTVIYSDTTTSLNSLSSSWTQQGSMQLSVPIGAWHLSHSGALEVTKGSVTDIGCDASLSTSTSSETDTKMHAHIEIEATSGTLGNIATVSAWEYISVSSATTYYTIVQGGSGISGGFRTSNGPYIIRAVCAYL